MEKFKITWQTVVHGDLIIEADSAWDAEEALRKMPREQLIKASKIWHSEDPISIECAETQFGPLDEQEWKFIYGA